MSGTRTITNDLTGGSVAKKLLRFSWPIMVANLLQTIYGLVDMVIVGHFVGAHGLSAVGIGGQIMMLFLTVGMSIGHAGQILIAQQIGAGDRDGLGWSVGTILSLEVLAGLVLGAGCAIFSRQILRLMNTPPEAFAQARAYVLVCGAGMLFVYGYNALSSILRGLGDSRLPMIAVAAAQVLNVLLDLVFVAGLRLGAGGAALATVIGQGLALGAVTVFLYRKRGSLGFPFDRRHLRIRRKNLMALTKVGLPLMAQALLISLSMTYINAMVNAYGVTASAVEAVGGKLNNILYIVIDGMAVGASAMIGQSFGARDFDRIREIHWYAVGFSVSISLVLCVILIAVPGAVFRLFTDDAAVLAMAPRYIWVVVVYSMAAATMVAPFSVVEGIGYTTFAMLASLADGVVARIGLGWLMGRLFGLYGFWFGSASAGFVTTILTGIYYLSGRWKNRQPIMETEAAG